MSDLAGKPAPGAPAAGSANISVRGQLSYGHDVITMCPQCLLTIPGRVLSSAAGVVMRKICPEHGAFESLIATDIASYERMRRSPRSVKLPERVSMTEAKGCPDDCGLCPAHEQHTCLAIVEITTRCNLPCPVCLADATAKGAEFSCDQVLAALRILIDTEGQPVPLQFAGGEPTLHSGLVDIVGGARALGFSKMEVDSNGLLLARDPRLAIELHAAGLTGVYLQMDGLVAQENEFIRGRDLRAEKLKAIVHCRDAGLQVVLAVTVVPGVNDTALWPLIRFAAEQRLTGINFQPVVLSGRYPPELAQSHRRFTATHFLRAIETQSEGLLRATDLMPMSCPDPRCGLLAYVVIDKDGQLLPFNRLVGDERLRQDGTDMDDWETVLRQLGCDSAACGCGDASGDARQVLAGVLEGAEFFSIGFHGMMDAYCFDQERARRCCVHKLTVDGKLMPFCLYNIKYRNKQGGTDDAGGRR
jgi:7,8-dihydro-6-hydroxymethylpterin dimethyltransferase